MNNDLQFIIEVPSQDTRDILIASLSDVGFAGFEENETQLIAYVKEGDFVEEELTSLLSQFALTYSKSVIEEQNWNEVWESNFQPVLISDFCLIRADFHPSAQHVQYEVVITPKMSFGTGHHATTYMMVQQMRAIDFRGKAVADFGTGTGILAILAEKLGAGYIRAIDNDHWSIENAKENFERNSCQNIQLEKANVFTSEKQFDIILANINRNVILENFNGLVFGLSQKGILLVSGILREDEQQIVKAAQIHNLVHTKTVERDKWISILFHKSQA